jgi:predicted murein hydrolase (TIGR00659 family)
MNPTSPLMHAGQLSAIWVYLATTPLLGLTITLVAYVLAHAIYERAHFNPLANPVAIAVALLVVLLTLTHTPYATYFEGAQFVHFLLGPATVALAVPLYRQLPKLRRAWWPLLGGLVAGSLTAIVSAIGIGALLGASRQTLASLAPKSVTTPIAMAVAEKIGGLPSLTAVLVISTGVLGAVIARGLLNLLRVEEPDVRGFALGVAAHGIGTARAFQVSEEMGAFAGLGMGLNGVLTAFVVPFVVPYFVPVLIPLVAQWLPR